MLRAWIGGLALAFTLLFAEPACAQSLTPAQKNEVRALVREVLRTNPELVEEALQEMERRREAAERARIAALRPKIEGDARDFSFGPRNAPVTIVEFFDYRCPYCHQSMEWVLEVMRRNPQTVRVIFKEFPVLGETSVEASQAAVASIKQGRYLPFHRALMGFRGQLNSAQIDTLARQSNIDVARMRRDMAQAAVFDHLKANHEIAAEAKVDGTPAFMINGAWVRGWDREEADRVLREALRARRR